MNDRMHAKIECCLELVQGCTPEQTSSNFKSNVKLVTGISESRFFEMGLTASVYKKLRDEVPPATILRELF